MDFLKLPMALENEFQMKIALTMGISFRMISYLTGASEPLSAWYWWSEGYVIGMYIQHWGAKILAVMATACCFTLLAGPIHEDDPEYHLEPCH